MGFLARSVSFCRYRAGDRLPPDYRENFLKRIQQFAFRSLDERPYADRSAGWVKLQDVYDSAFTESDVFKDPYLVLALRVDVKSVSPKILTHYCRQAEDQIRVQEERAHISKERRREIREAVHAQLMQRALPRTASYDMVWNLDSGNIYFSSVQTRTGDDFSELFLKTFELGLTLVFPFTLATQTFEKRRWDPTEVEHLPPLQLVKEAV